LLVGVYGCRPTKPKVIANDSKDVEITADTSIALQDTLVKVITPPVVADREVDTIVEVISPPVVINRAVDTLFFQPVDLTRTVVGQRNPIGLRQGNIEVEIPVRINKRDPNHKDSLIAFAYWIGIGEPDISAYAALTEEIPPEWSQPGVSAPLAAYWLGYPVVLPGPTDSLASQRPVRFDFVDSRGKAAFAKQKSYTPPISRDPERPNFGIVSGAQLQGLYDNRSRDPEQGEGVLHFFLAFANQHEINSYRVQLKVIGVYGVFER
jgi:hypothetical protein